VGSTARAPPPPPTSLNPPPEIVLLLVINYAGTLLYTIKTTQGLRRDHLRLKCTKSPGRRGSICLGAYNATSPTTHAIAGFRGRSPGKGREKGGTEKMIDRVMEGRGGTGRERIERKERKAGGLAPWVQGHRRPLFNSRKQSFFSYVLA